MILEIAPDYELLMAIILVCWVLNGLLNVVNGLLQVKKSHRDKCGCIEILTGGIVLLLAAWVVF